MGNPDQPQAQQEYQCDQQGVEAPPYEACVDNNQPTEILTNHNIDEQVNYNVTDVTKSQTYIVQDQYDQQDQANLDQYPPSQQNPQANPVQYPPSQQKQQQNPVQYPPQQNQQQNPVQYPSQQSYQQNPVQYPPQQNQQRNPVQYPPQENQQQNPIQYPTQQNQQQNPVQQNQQQNPIQYPPHQNQQQNPIQYPSQQNQQQNPVQYPPQQNRQQNPVQYPPQQNQQYNPVQYPPHQNQQQNPVQFSPTTPPPSYPRPGLQTQFFASKQTSQPTQCFQATSQAAHQPYQSTPPPQCRPPPVPPNLLSPNEPVLGRPLPNQSPIPMPQAGTQPWRTGLFDCMDDPENAIRTAILPCVTFGQIAEIVDSGQTTCASSGLMYGCIASLIGCPCILSYTYRTKLRSKFGLMESPAQDWMIHGLFEWCALCQEYRELNKRGLDPSIGWQGNLAKSNMPGPMAMKPPACQTMNY